MIQLPMHSLPWQISLISSMSSILEFPAQPDFTLHNCFSGSSFRNCPVIHCLASMTLFNHKRRCHNHFTCNYRTRIKWRVLQSLAVCLECSLAPLKHICCSYPWFLFWGAESYWGIFLTSWKPRWVRSCPKDNLPLFFCGSGFSSISLALSTQALTPTLIFNFSTAVFFSFQMVFFLFLFAPLGFL